MLCKLPAKSRSIILKNLSIAALILLAVALLATYWPFSQDYANSVLHWFLPGLFLLFMVARILAQKLGTLLEQPPLMVFLMALVMKLLGGLVLLMVYLMKGLGPPLEGSFSFLLIYLIFEILEIKWFLSILRPDSRENTPE